MSKTDFDYAIIGSGIAGASIASALSAEASVAIFEAESHAGYHATGRSAAAILVSYGNAVVREISRRSLRFYLDPPAGFADAALIKPRDLLMIAADSQVGTLQQLSEETPGLQPVSVSQACELVPILDHKAIAAAALETGCGDLEVDVILQGFLRTAKANGAQRYFGNSVTRLRNFQEVWEIETASETVTAEVVINAAGAWADHVAQMAGLTGLGLSPLRRSAMLVSLDGIENFDDWPLVLEAPENMYFRPDAGKLLISPANEDPSPPCDAQPEELDIALGVHRFEQRTDQKVKRVDHQWAGLRTFAPDRSPVVGFDPRVKGFFWFAGQGGYGVQMAPGLAAIGRDIARGRTGDDSLSAGISPERLILDGRLVGSLATRASG